MLKVNYLDKKIQYSQLMMTSDTVGTPGSPSKPSSWDFMVLIPLSQDTGQTAGQNPKVWHHLGLKSTSWKSGDHLEENKTWEVVTRSMDEGRTRVREGGDLKKSIIWFLGSKTLLLQQEKQT